MKLTLKEITDLMYGGITPVAEMFEEELIDFARAIEAACNPKWLPIESAPRDCTNVRLKLTYRETIGYTDRMDKRFIEYNGNPKWLCDHNHTWVDESREVFGWMPLPEVE